jgi:septal ring factor EnvC (AmiA/AmiB activator)
MPPAPPSEHRTEDLPGWVAHLRIRIDAVLAVTIFSLLAAIAAVVLAVSAQNDSATKDQVRTLRNDVEGVGQEAAAAKKDVNAFSTRLDSIENRLSTFSGNQRTNQDELSAVQDDIKGLREEISNLKGLREQISNLEDSVASDSGAQGGSASSP